MSRVFGKGELIVFISLVLFIQPRHLKNILYPFIENHAENVTNFSIELLY